VEGDRFGFDPIRPTGSTMRPCQACLRRTVEHDREVGDEAVACRPVERADDVEVEPPPVPLICDRGIREAVAQNDATGREGGSDHALDVLTTVGQVEQQLRRRRGWLVRDLQEHGPQRAAEWCSPRLACQKNRVTGRQKLLGHALHERRFPRALDPLHGDEQRHVRGL
jgi:hypothetical protein